MKLGYPATLDDMFRLLNEEVESNQFHVDKMISEVDSKFPVKAAVGLTLSSMAFRYDPALPESCIFVTVCLGLAVSATFAVCKYVLFVAMGLS